MYEYFKIHWHVMEAEGKRTGLPGAWQEFRAQVTFGMPSPGPTHYRN